MSDEEAAALRTLGEVFDRTFRIQRAHEMLVSRLRYEAAGGLPGRHRSKAQAGPLLWPCVALTLLCCLCVEHSFALLLFRVPLMLMLRIGRV